MSEELTCWMSSLRVLYPRLPLLLMAFWIAASISANEAGSDAPALVVAAPILGLALMAGRRSASGAPAVGTEFVADVFGEPSRPPTIIPAPKPASVKSARRMTVLVFMRGLCQDDPWPRSEEHTSELQSLRHLVCRLLLEK